MYLITMFLLTLSDSVKNHIRLNVKQLLKIKYVQNSYIFILIAFKIYTYTYYN